MSYSNGTAHYNLPQTVGSDKRDWFDTNEAFRNLDSAVASAVAGIEGISGSVETLTSDVNALGERVGIAEENIGTLGAGLSTTNEQLASATSALNGLATTVGENKTDIEDMIESNNEPSATSAHSYNVGDYFIFNDTLYKCTITIHVGDTIVPNVNCSTTDVMSRVKALEEGGGSEPTASAVSYNNSVSGLSATDVQSAIDEIVQGGQGGVEIDDSTTSGTKVWSSQKTNTVLGTKANASNVYTKAEIDALLAQIGGTMPELDFDNAVDLGGSDSHMNYTTSTRGAIVIGAAKGKTTGTYPLLFVDGSAVQRFSDSGGGYSSAIINFIGAGSVITTDANLSYVTGTNAVFVPYK